ncbi:MAG TPA: ornithine cyclodeaminase family protein [Actinomycetales bacterium]|nr:ornithine cyclodeaminase family protein [Actinomycetales bacterium]
MSATSLPWFDASRVEALLPMREAVDAIESALRDGFDPASDPARGLVGTRHGHLLLMPSEVGSAVGVKVASVAPGNPEHGLPRIQAVYVLMDGETLRPVAVLDGTSLTALRTPAVSAVAVRHLAVPHARRLVVLGSGPQAAGHVAALRTVRPVDDVVVVARDRTKAQGFADQVGATGLGARVGTVDDVAHADLVVCATTSATPVLPGELVADHACVVAVGSHEPNRRELDEQLMGRATVVVEDRDTALREAGDVVLAAGRGVSYESLVSLRELVRGAVPVDGTRPRVFKSVGMSWQDLVVAAEVVRRAS